MVTLFRLSKRRIPALIGVLAILMLFIAPGVSKALAHWHLSDKGETASHNVAAMQHMDMGAIPMPHHFIPDTSSSTHDKVAGHHSNHGHAEMGNPMDIMDDLACGYCQLLVHFPLLAWIFAPLLWLMRLSSHAPPFLTIPAYPSTFFAGILQPRAPPAP